MCSRLAVRRCCRRAAVPERQRKVIRFTQSKIGFNHGWLVQGEAPPAALFSKFKGVIQAEHVSSSDVAFYFVHWLTDLAGAEPTPLRGSEKFVLKFPHFVLDSFIQSFHVINELANRSETEVFEAYLIERWQVGGPDCRPTLHRISLLLELLSPDASPLSRPSPELKPHAL